MFWLKNDKRKILKVKNCCLACGCVELCKYKVHVGYGQEWSVE